MKFLIVRYFFVLISVCFRSTAPGGNGFASLQEGDGFVGLAGQVAHGGHPFERLEEGAGRGSVALLCGEHAAQVDGLRTVTGLCQITGRLGQIAVFKGGGGGVDVGRLVVGIEAHSHLEHLAVVIAARFEAVGVSVKLIER